MRQPEVYGEVTLFGVEYPLRMRTDEADMSYQAFISTEYGELVASSTWSWNAVMRLEMLVQWLNEGAIVQEAK